MRFRNIGRTTTIIAVLLIGFEMPAFAKMGGAPEVAVSKKASTKTDVNGWYTINQIESDGLRVQEYSSNDGVVFAVAWRGSIRPNLSQLLGDYYTEYASALKEKAKTSSLAQRRVATTIQTDNVSVRKEGHMRDWKGFAYVPALVPSGVNIGDLND